MGHGFVGGGRRIRREVGGWERGRAARWGKHGGLHKVPSSFPEPTKHLPALAGTPPPRPQQRRWPTRRCGAGQPPTRAHSWMTSQCSWPSCPSEQQYPSTATANGISVIQMNPTVTFLSSIHVSYALLTASSCALHFRRQSCKHDQMCLKRGREQEVRVNMQECNWVRTAMHNAGRARVCRLAQSLTVCPRPPPLSAAPAAPSAASPPPPASPLFLCP